MHRNRLSDYIAEGVSRDEYEVPQPAYGFHFPANNSASEVVDPNTFMLHSKAGSRLGFNVLDVNTPAGLTPSPALVNYRVFKGRVLAIADSFEPDFISVSPSDLPWGLDFDKKSYTRQPAIPIGWMLYLKPDLARQASLPASFIQEACPGGGLFLAVTDQTFELGNVTHRRGTIEMEAMLEPLNGMTRKT